MRKRSSVVVLTIALTLAGQGAVFATDTQSATPSPTAKASHPALTQKQTEEIADARAAFALAKTNAQDGFSRAIADAQAIRDQAIASAGKNANSIRSAKNDYRASYKVVWGAYKAAQDLAKSVLKDAIASALASK